MHRAEQDEFKTRRKSRSRRAKNQAPNPKLQRSSKSQAPNPKNRCRGKRRAGRFLSLELGASLELGVWNLELVAWARSFSKIEMRCARWSEFPKFILRGYGSLLQSVYVL